jgi:hypothetical protein
MAPQLSGVMAKDIGLTGLHIGAWAIHLGGITRVSYIVIMGQHMRSKTDIRFGINTAFFIEQMVQQGYTRMAKLNTGLMVNGIPRSMNTNKRYNVEKQQENKHGSIPHIQA